MQQLYKAGRGLQNRHRCSCQKLEKPLQQYHQGPGQQTPKNPTPLPSRVIVYKNY